MRVDVLPTAAEAAARAATLIVRQLRRTVLENGHATVALSGGHTPRMMLQGLASSTLPWPQIHIFQVDERIVGDDDPRRNLRQIRTAFAASPIPPENVHGMPVTRYAPEACVARYYEALCACAGSPPIIDVVHLGLGEDGHTASLVPDDDSLESDQDIVLTGRYGGVRRMTLNLPVLNRAKCLVWLVTGSSKADIVARFLQGDPTLVASRVGADAAMAVLDRDAAATL